MESSKPLRLLFLCSSLEPGRDGVGDYVRLLAEACARRGHVCALLALNDPFAVAPLETDFGPVHVARLPALVPWRERMAEARAVRYSFRPDWISFHLVPYAFQPRGLLHGMIASFREIVGDLPLHFMFHEIWLGGGRPTPLRQRFTGFFQRHGIRRLLRQLHPRLVTTSNPVYVALLRQLGVEVMLLPLFGNVPLAANDATGPAAVAETLARAGITPENRAGWWIGVFFGSLHAEWTPEPFLGLLQDAAQKAGRKILLVQVGRAGAAGEAIWRAMKAAYGSAIVFRNLGELPSAVISAWLREGDFGVAASPWFLIGKSGTVAAMLDHGLPVIVNRDDFQPDVAGDVPPSLDPLLHRLDASLPGKLIAGLPKRAPHLRVDEVAAQLCAAMEAISTNASP
jgi:hypothetical protein